ncbi:MAG TPA: cupin domain-containing protein [Desulfobacteraceae bacterium]|nr:cupin domain-containing protein [Deltaproteobacteria bacterium]MBW2356994.1 cupin domain-containing protein [Deltaproteobacteria bacterium]HDI59971.1 cupin domain-containing protein [Desulfobacteraceae bacterium]
MKPVDLVAHPEGGRFRRVYQSQTIVRTAGGEQRAALTHIYFSLEPGEKSRFHRVASDEVWNLYRGAGLRLHFWDGTGRPPDCVVLSAEANRYCHVIPAGIWQAAEPIADAVLVGCSVAPGFEYVDFELMAPAGEAAARLRAVAPALARFTVA